MISTKKKILLIGIILLLITILFGIFYKKIISENNNEIFTNINCYAESAIVMDVNSHRVLYSFNENIRLLPASITKILTCITCLEYYDLNQIVIVGDEILNTEGSSIYLQKEDIITIEDLLYGLMLCSGNDAACVLSKVYSGNESDFIYLMNEMAKKIGMFNSTFENASGLDSKTKNYTTAYDMALLMSYAMKNEIFKKITSTKNYVANLKNNRKLYFHNKHRLVNQNLAIGGKTGYTKLAKRTLVSCFEKDNNQIVVVTFKCNDDWNFHKQISSYCFNKFEYNQLISKFEINLNSKKNYLVTNLDLRFPHQKNEIINYEIINNYNSLTINYYLNNNKIGYKVISKKK